MATLDVYNLEKKKVGSVTLDDSVVATEVKEHLFHEVVRAQLASRRAGTHSTKTRSEVHGTAKKPFRQKGTGRARAGTIRSPIWRGGGTTFAAKPRDYSKKVNKKMYRGAMQAILSELVRQERLVVATDFKMEAAKTKEMVAKLKELELDNVLIVVEEVDDRLYLAARNLKNVDVVDVQGVNPVNLIGFEKVLFTVDALRKAEEKLA